MSDDVCVTEIMHCRTRRLLWFGWGSVSSHAAVYFSLSGMIVNCVLWHMPTRLQGTFSNQSGYFTLVFLYHQKASSGPYRTSDTLLGHRQVPRHHQPILLLCLPCATCLFEECAGRIFARDVCDRLCCAVVALVCRRRSRIHECALG